MSADGALPLWGSDGWSGPSLAPTTTTDGWRVWRWTDADLALMGLSPGASRRDLDAVLADPPGRTQPGLALLRAGVPVLALGRNPAGRGGDYDQWVLRREGADWVAGWLVREDSRGARLLTVEGGTAGTWDRRTRGRLRPDDQFRVAGRTYLATEVKGGGRWLPLTGIELSKGADTVLTIGGTAPLTRDIDRDLPVWSGPDVDARVWALALGVFASVWDTQVAATAG